MTSAQYPRRLTSMTIRQVISDLNVTGDSKIQNPQTRLAALNSTYRRGKRSRAAEQTVTKPPTMSKFRCKGLYSSDIGSAAGQRTRNAPNRKLASPAMRTCRRLFSTPRKCRFPSGRYTTVAAVVETLALDHFAVLMLLLQCAACGLRLLQRHRRRANRGEFFRPSWRHYNDIVQHLAVSRLQVEPVPGRHPFARGRPRPALDRPPPSAARAWHGPWSASAPCGYFCRNA